MRTNIFNKQQKNTQNEQNYAADESSTNKTLNKQQVNDFLQILQQLYYKNYVVKHTFSDKLSKTTVHKEKQQLQNNNVSINVIIRHYKNYVMNRYFTHLVFSKKYTPNFLKIYRLTKYNIYLEISKLNNRLIGIHIPSEYLQPHKKLKSYYVKKNKNLLLTQYDLINSKKGECVSINNIDHYQYVSLSWMNASLIAIHVHMGNNLLNN